MSVGALVGDQHVLLVEMFATTNIREQILTVEQFEAFKISRPTGYPEITPQIRAAGVALTVRNYRELVKQQWLSSWHAHARTAQRELKPDTTHIAQSNPPTEPWYRGPRTRRY